MVYRVTKNMLICRIILFIIMTEILQFLTKFKNIFNKYKWCLRSNSSTNNVICQIFNQILKSFRICDFLTIKQGILCNGRRCKTTFADINL